MKGLLPYFIVISLWLTPDLLWAQLEVKPVSRDQFSAKTSHTRVSAANDTISLPFWDDFSYATINPDTAIWSENKGVLINATLGNPSPSLNVASFDGNASSGIPHNVEEPTYGTTDQLTSKPMNTADIAVDKRSTVYFSFYWQMRGLGEIPESKDSLIVEFKNMDNTWSKVFAIGGTDENLHDDFTKASIALDQEKYFHEGFQFRFTTKGNTGGPFDSWHIDYVYLNQDRTMENESLLDRTVASLPTSIFSRYSMIPHDVIFQFPDTIYKDVQVDISSFENNIHPVRYEYTLTDTLTSSILYNLNTTGPPLTNLGRSTITIPAVSGANLMGVGDSLYLLSQLILDTSDDYFISEIDGTDTTYLINESRNYRLNDTVRSYFQVHHTLAYDDGTAEYAAGLNKNESQLAVEFNIPSQDTVTHVNIYFPQVKPLSSGKTINIYVLKDLSGEEQSVLSVQEFATPQATGINAFSTFELNVPAIVSGKFYIAFQQFTNDYIGIGLDNQNQIGTDVIWVKTEEEWERNAKVEGILMIRPIFKDSDYVVAGIGDTNRIDVSVYPNPANQKLTVSGDFDYFELYSLSGKLKITGHEREISVTDLPEGLYIFKARTKKGIYTTKVVVQR